MKKLGGINPKIAFGMVLETGGYDELLSDLKVKPGYLFDWPDEHGYETDPDEPIVFDRRIYSLPILLKGDGLQDLIQKYSAFLTFLKGSKDIIMETGLPDPLRYFKVRFSSLTAFNRLNTFTENGEVGCKFTLTFTDDHPLGYQPVPGDFIVDTTRPFNPTIVAMRGDSFGLEIELQDDDGRELNLVGMSYTVNIANMSIALQLPGTLVLSATSAQMAAMPLGERPLSIVQTSESNEVKTIIQGVLYVIE